MTAQTTYRIKLNLNGLEVEIEGDKEFVESKLSDLSWVDNLTQKLVGRGVKPSSKIAISKSGSSFTELSSQLNPQSHLQKILTIAYYLYSREDRDFTYDDIENYYEQRRWSRPSNPRDAVSDLIKEGYIEESSKINGKKSFRILEKGIRYVESGFKEE
ncbi:MAG: hypothetical protein NZ929_02265 [Aigarchaeota archaeon]|nr:hypothetical protein [Aigarchaeota archaeon]MCX8192974.1 hypothetical protein [Nitrososphaeria archaeon]MDW7986290.1 hypothetical protein [Nitrososphaerota archaeon]